jgi:hypothetical protein
MAQFNEAEKGLWKEGPCASTTEAKTKHVETIKIFTRIKKLCNFTENIILQKKAFTYI